MSHATSSKGGRILLVEDDGAARHSLIQVLSRAGYVVEALPDGEQAVTLLTAPVYNGHYDVVLTDLMMRGVDGLQVLKRSRELADPPEVILLTGYGTLQTAIEALRAGAFDYLLKPSKPDELLRSIERAMEWRSAQKAQAAAVQLLVRGLRRSGREEQDEALLDRPVGGELAAPRHHDTIGDLQLLRGDHVALLAGEQVNLTVTEFAILCRLADAAGHLVTYSELVRAVYKQTCDEGTAQKLLKTHMHNLRHKLIPEYIVNVRGTGYKLVAPPAP